MPEGKPRRPAMLKQNQAEMIVGANRVDDQVELAHFLADLLLDRVPESEKTYISNSLQLREDAIENLMDILQRGDVEVVAELWADLPSASIPGLMWRLYLVYQWYLRDSAVVERRYRQGLKFLAKTNQVSFPPSVAPLMKRICKLWKGSNLSCLVEILAQTAVALKIMATGVDAEWITDHKDILADRVTVRPAAIRATAKELEIGLSLLKNNQLR